MSNSEGRFRECKHFNGTRNHECKVGVCYKDFLDRGQLLPCMHLFPPDDSLREVGTCNRRVMIVVD